MVHFSWLRSKFRRAAAHNHNHNHNQNHSKNVSGPLSWSKSEMAPQRSLSARENWGSRGGGDWPSCSTLHWGSDSCPNSSSSSPPEEDVKNDEMIAQVLSEELSHGDDVGKRLTHLPSIPHQPKVNTAIRPTQDDASLDHERHLERLNLYGLREAKMMGDGNCQFRALSHQIYFTPEYHKFIRKQVVKQLRNQRDLYEGYVPMKYGEYLKKMSRAGEWGDHVTLQAAADHFGIRICLITSFKDTCFIEIVPKQRKRGRDVYLSFWSEVHYNSVYTETGPRSQSEMEKRKKHWLYF